MDAQILLDKAKLASEQHLAFNDEDRLSFRVGYLEATIKQLCYLLDDTEAIMYRQRDLIEQLKKDFGIESKNGHSADL